MGFQFSNITALAHSILEDYLQPGMVVVDATVGNGHDTVFLTSKVGSQGEVHGFDVQEQAIHNTKKRLESFGITEGVTLYLLGHEQIQSTVHKRIHAAMYNLGYLPGSNEEVITIAETTIPSIEGALNLLMVNGIITIAVYYGHEGGVQEKTALEEYLHQLDAYRYQVLHFELFNRKNCPPKLFVIKKVRE